MSTTLSLGIVEPAPGTTPWDATVNNNFLILNNAVYVLVQQMASTLSNVSSVLNHQVTDESAITTLQSAVSTLQGIAFPVWNTFTVTISGSNWQVNGVNVATLDTVNATQQIPLFTTGNGTVFSGVALKTLIPFSGAIASYVASLGTAAIPDTLMSTTGDFYDLMPAAGNSNFYVAGGAKAVSMGPTGVVLNVVTSGLNKTISSATSGSVQVSVLASGVFGALNLGGAFSNPAFGGQSIFITPGPLSNGTGTFVSHGGSMLILTTATCYSNPAGMMGVTVNIDGSPIATGKLYANTAGIHTTLPMIIVFSRFSIGSHTLSLSALNAATLTDSNDQFQSLVLEFPF